MDFVVCQHRGSDLSRLRRPYLSAASLRQCARERNNPCPDREAFPSNRMLEIICHFATFVLPNCTIAMLGSCCFCRNSDVSWRYQRVIVQKCRKRGIDMNIAFPIERIIFGGYWSMASFNHFKNLNYMSETRKRRERRLPSWQWQEPGSSCCWVVSTCCWESIL